MGINPRGHGGERGTGSSRSHRSPRRHHRRRPRQAMNVASVGPVVPGDGLPSRGHGLAAGGATVPSMERRHDSPPMAAWTSARKRTCFMRTFRHLHEKADYLLRFRDAPRARSEGVNLIAGDKKTSFFSELRKFPLLRVQLLLSTAAGFE